MKMVQMFSYKIRQSWPRLMSVKKLYLNLTFVILIFAMYNYLSKYNNKSYSALFRIQLSNSKTWFPINQTRLEKYGAAVLSRINFNMDLS